MAAKRIFEKYAGRRVENEGCENAVLKVRNAGLTESQEKRRWVPFQDTQSAAKQSEHNTLHTNQVGGEK